LSSLRVGVGDEGTNEVGFKSLDEELANLRLLHAHTSANSLFFAHRQRFPPRDWAVPDAASILGLEGTEGQPVYVEVKPEMLRWARERARASLEDLRRRFPHLSSWEAGDAKPTLRQLEEFARATHAPVGFLFLNEPPIERVPIPDFRTVAQRTPSRLSPNLLDTLYVCQQRQEWYRDFARSMGESALPFVGSARLSQSVETTAATIRDTLHFSLDERRQCSTWADALRLFVEKADGAGVLVMVTGVVGNNTRRKLDPDEFRGFALADDLAPLVFVNGADTKAAQMFTLAHELAHVWLGQSALSDAEPKAAPSQTTEHWCNRVAAELLVPLVALRHEFQASAGLDGEVTRLARYFKVSTLVILRRLHDLGALSKSAFASAYGRELARLMAIVKSSGGGTFYHTQAVRIGKRFARALIVSTLEGQTLHRDAFRLLGLSKVETFHALARSLEVAA
jgi:Zn-dependent peptidase ImmA (M78 family)